MSLQSEEARIFYAGGSFVKLSTEQARLALASLALPTSPRINLFVFRSNALAHMDRKARGNDAAAVRTENHITNPKSFLSSSRRIFNRFRSPLYSSQNPSPNFFSRSITRSYSFCFTIIKAPLIGG